MKITQYQSQYLNSSMISISNLHRSNDKRKQGIKELEDYIKTSYDLTTEKSINTFLTEVTNLSDVSQPQYIRKAAFLCYNTLAHLLKQIPDLSKDIIHILIRNAINFFKDNDSKIVCSAAECLYNLMKYYSDVILQHFEEVFEGLFLISVNQDHEVKSIAQTLDSYLKEIVNYKFQTNNM
jgi:hypothetical protein